MKETYCRIGFIQFPLFICLAMLLNEDFTLSNNFLSDLGRISTENFLSWLLFTISLILLGLSLMLFYREDITGFFSGICFVFVALFSIDLNPLLHMFFAILAFILLTIASIKADMKLLTGILIVFFFNFLIADSISMQVLNQKFAILSIIILHLANLYNIPFLVNNSNIRKSDVVS